MDLHPKNKEIRIAVSRRRYLLRLVVIIVTALLPATRAVAQVNHVVISEVYGGGGNSGATWKNDFVELYNPTNQPVVMTNWSIQYASAAGSFGTTNLHVFSGVIQPKSFFLIQESQGTGGSKDLPTPDAIGTLALSSSQGKVALSSGTAPVSGPTDASVVDFVGYSTATNSYEGSGPAPALTNTTSAERKASATSTDVTLGPGGSEEKAGNGYDTNNNAADFVAQSNINPQNSLSPREPPPVIQAGIGVASITPQIVKADTAMRMTIVLHGVSDGILTGLRFVKHALLDWTRATIKISASNGVQPVLRQTKDTVIVGSFSLTASDSLLVGISGLAAPDTTVKLAIRFETAAGSDSTAPVNPLPSVTLFGNPRAVAVVKVNDTQGVPLNLQKPVTVRGIVTVAKEFGGPAYIQDASGGLAVFDLNFENSVRIGDEVTLTGIVTQFNGLTELASVTLHTINSSGNDVTPVPVTCVQLTHDGANGIEFYEGMLVQLNRVTVRDASGLPFSTWAVSGSGANFWLHDNTDSVQVRIDGDVSSIANAPAPAGEFDLVGVVGQFVSSAPFAGGYQVMPRFASDVLAKGPVITSQPLESSITSTSFDIQWETARAGSSFVRYGRTKNYEMGIIGSAAALTTHRATVAGLTPAATYHVVAFSVSGPDTSFSGDRVVGTASQGSTGQINVYFNKSINPSVARGDTAKGNANLTDLLIRRINAARKSVDCAVYSFSGQVGQSIAAALVQAWNRGVKVRFIIEHDNMYAGSGTTVNQYIVPAGIPWIMDDFDAVNGGVGLQHNKFFIIDARGTPDQSWVWTGSWNPTDPGTNDDLQNSIEIQDQALAGAYTIEFNEMWGSDSTVANAANSRFGAHKLDNTPHIFNINGTPVELYFSPSDRTTSHILGTLSKAQNSINVAMLTLTRSDLAGVMVSKKTAGMKVRAILDNGTDTGSQFAFLQSSNVDVHLKPNIPGLFHHKYAVIDGELSTAAQYVITGSHNWTSTAETSNNENTLIIQNNRIANLYLQEFSARYKEVQGADNIVVGVTGERSQIPASTALMQNYPNPFNPETTLRFAISGASFVTLKIYDVLGREVAAIVDGVRNAGTYTLVWNAAAMPSGVYFSRLEARPLAAGKAGVYVETKRMIVMK